MVNGESNPKPGIINTPAPGVRLSGATVKGEMNPDYPKQVLNFITKCVGKGGGDSCRNQE